MNTANSDTPGTSTEELYEYCWDPVHVLAGNLYIVRGSTKIFAEWVKGKKLQFLQTLNAMLNL